jgi:hypothetical protein
MSFEGNIRTDYKILMTKAKESHVPISKDVPTPEEIVERAMFLAKSEKDQLEIYNHAIQIGLIKCRA